MHNLLTILLHHLVALGNNVEQENRQQVRKVVVSVMQQEQVVCLVNVPINLSKTAIPSVVCSKDLVQCVVFHQKKTISLEIAAMNFLVLAALMVFVKMEFLPLIAW
jgi:hypothetical protein